MPHFVRKLLLRREPVLLKRVKTVGKLPVQTIARVLATHCHAAVQSLPKRRSKRPPRQVLGSERFFLLPMVRNE